MKKLTPSEKRAETMKKKYGDNWRRVVSQKISQTYLERFTPEQRSEIARKGGMIGGKVSPTTFKPGDERAIRYGKLKKPRTESESE